MGKGHLIFAKSAFGAGPDDLRSRGLSDCGHPIEGSPIAAVGHRGRVTVVTCGGGRAFARCGAERPTGDRRASMSELTGIRQLSAVLWGSVLSGPPVGGVGVKRDARTAIDFSICSDVAAPGRLINQAAQAQVALYLITQCERLFACVSPLGNNSQVE